jgi:pyridoxal phosphate enzyme (YggS family)
MFNKEAYEQIKSQIPSSVSILAATKTKPVEDIISAINAGIALVGENYVQEAEEKYNKLFSILKEKKVSFHLIGHLQSNKAKIAAKIFDCIQTIDSIKLARKLNNECKLLEKKMDIFIEVNFEGQKSGVSLENLPSLVEEIKLLKNLNLRGLMAIPPIGKEVECFKVLRNLNEQFNLNELSIGMSSDYHIAIEYGSTLIRLGTSLFGKRN